jgi:type I restriction enzyme S subunit
VNAVATEIAWQSYRLRDVVTKLVDGSHNPPPKQDQGRPMLSARNVDQGRINYDEFRYISEESFEAEHARTRVAPGDVLLTIVGTIGRSAVVPEAAVPFALQRSVAVLSPKGGLLPKFLSYQLQSPQVQRYFEHHARGTAQKGVYLKTLGETPIVVPPISEQQAVVAELEKQFSRLDEAVANLKRVKAKLERYRAASLGQLTTRLGNCLSDEEPAGTELDEVGQDLGAPLPALPRHWKWTAVGTVGRVRGGKRLPLGHKYADERTSHPYLRVTDFVDFGIDDSGLQYLSSATHRAIERYTISTKDVYISIAGSIGLVGQVPAHLDNANLTENAAKITDLQGVEPKFLVYWLASPTGRRLIAKSTIATTQSKLALFRVEKLPLPLPPIDEQRRIVAKVDRRLSIVREVEAEVDANLKRAQALRQAVLARAFAGANEAVPSST